MKGIKTFLDLDVYQLAHSLAMKIFKVSKMFPKEEKYSLIDQIRRSSRSIAVNMAEGRGKRRYPELFKRHLIDALGSLEETKSWLLLSADCKYLPSQTYDELLKKYDRVGCQII